MKKTALVLTLTLLLSIMLVACNREADNGEQPEQVSSSHSAAPGSSTSVPSEDEKIQDSPKENEKADEPIAAAESTEPSGEAPAPSETSVPAETPTPSEMPEPKPQASMSITSTGVSGGVLADEYGMRGKQQKDSVPTLSLPISIKDAPEGTVCYAVIVRDPDSKPLCGYEWTHWLAANISGAEIAVNASIDNAADMVQGKNDFGTTGYGGPTPPDKPHTYIITVYALDARLDLNDGFSKDALEKFMTGHVLAVATLSAKYGN